MLPFALGEPQLWRYSLQSAASAPLLRDYILAALAKRVKQREYPFIVFDKHAGQFAGVTRFYEINNRAQTALIGYTWYGQAYQGTGLNQACKALLLTFAFQHCGLERIEFRADASNERSIQAIRKLGARLEGMLRSHLPRQGWMVDDGIR